MPNGATTPATTTAATPLHSDPALRRKCFVIMPFGEKKDLATGATIDFNDLYEFMIKGAIEGLLGLDCIRCDEIISPGSIHRDMIRQIFDAHVAVVDITSSNPNVLYELGVRHALRKGVTVIIRRAGVAVPFNINGLRVIEYDPSKVMTLVKGRDDIAAFVRAGLRNGECDSLVHEQLPDLRVSRTPRICPVEVFEYRRKGEADDQRRIRLITGDIERIKNVDIWVSSENTNMQMARYYDGSLSGLIRFLGAEKNERHEVDTDIISDDLAQRMGVQRTVPPTTVIATKSGKLQETNGVKHLLHAAVVQGSIGRGYAPVEAFERSVTSALAIATSRPEFRPCTSILFPLFCSGTAKFDAGQSFARMLDTVLEYLETNAPTNLKEIYLLAWSEAERQACLDELDRRADRLEFIGRCKSCLQPAPAPAAPEPT